VASDVSPDEAHARLRRSAARLRAALDELAEVGPSEVRDDLAACVRALERVEGLRPADLLDLLDDLLPLLDAIDELADGLAE